jgi:Protein of unknown function (DUF2914)/Tetratricopeptide repeat
LVEAAEQAAAADDYVSAEQLLREAALQQEAQLGSLHPDLANTLNNLGVVCDLADKVDEAEHCYRTAYGIATAAFGSDHPFVITSRKNLEDFCTARGLPFRPATSVKSPERAPTIPVESTVEAPIARPPEQPPTIPVESTVDAAARSPEQSPAIPVAGTVEAAVASGSSRGLVIAAVVAGAIVLAVFLALRLMSGSVEPAGPASDESIEPAPETLAASPGQATPTVGDKAGEATRAATRAERTATPVEPASRRGSVPAASRSTSPAPASSPLSPPLVANAALCRALSIGESRGSAVDWRCDPATRSVDPGSLIFYTRLKSQDDTTVLHRWYRGDRLQQEVTLRIRANAAVGYRTYSRQTMDSRRAGDWKVELRTQDGVLLHEEGFVVR